MLSQHRAGPCRKAQEVDEASFNLSEAKRKLQSLQSKNVSQQDVNTNSPTDRLSGKSLNEVLMVEIYAG